MQDAQKDYEALTGGTGSGPGGGGVAFRSGSASAEIWRRHAYIFPTGGWRTDGGYDPVKAANIGAYRSFVTTFREMFHLAGKRVNYTHRQMDVAATNLGAASLDDYIRKNCVPKQYW